MKELDRLNPIDRRIFRALSFHGHLSTLQLWYEVTGNENRHGSVTQEEVLRRLEALTAQGLVEPISQEERSVRWALKKGKVFDATLVLT